MQIDIDRDEVYNIWRSRINRKGREKTTASYVGAEGYVETSLPCLHVWKRDLALAMMRLRTSREEGGEWVAFGGMVGYNG